MQLTELPNRQLTESLIHGGLDADGGGAASSHWRAMHRGTNVELAGGLELAGRGFGTVQSCRSFQLPFEWLTTACHALGLNRKGEWVRALQTVRGLLGRLKGEYRLKLTFDAARQAFAWHALRPHLPSRPQLKWLIVGDGYGLFSALVKACRPDARLWLVDLPKTLVFQTVYVQMMHPECRHALAGAGTEADFSYCPAPSLPENDGPFDVVVNVASMQEMNRLTIGEYFDFFRRSARPDNVFYCCNRIEKILPDGEVIRFEEYPWKDGDVRLLDGPCRFQRFFFHPRTLKRGPRFCGIRIPFVNHYDGDTWHRAARLEVAR